MTSRDSDSKDDGHFFGNSKRQLTISSENPLHKGNIIIISV